MTLQTEIMTSEPLFKKTFVLVKPGVTIFCDIIKTVIIFIKTIIEDSRKVKRIRNYVPERNLYLCFLIEQNLLIPVKKC